MDKTNVKRFVHYNSTDTRYTINRSGPNDRIHTYIYHTYAVVTINFNPLLESALLFVVSSYFDTCV